MTTKKPQTVYTEIKTIKGDDGNHYVKVSMVKVVADYPVGQMYILHEEMGPSDDWVDSVYSKAQSILPDSHRITDAEAQRKGIAAFDSLYQKKLDEVVRPNR